MRLRDSHCCRRWATEDRPMNQALVDLAVALVAGIILAGFGAMCLRIDMRPKVEVSYRAGPMSSGGGPPDALQCKWFGTLSFYNPTPFTAHKISILLPDKWNLPRLALNPPHLDSGETREIEFNVVRCFVKTDVFPDEQPSPQSIGTRPRIDPLKDLYPEELRDFSFLLRYSNGHGIALYTRFHHTERTDDSTHHRFRKTI